MRRLYKLHPWAVRIDVVVILIVWAILGYGCNTLNNGASWVEATRAPTKVTQTYLGRNASALATSITGSTVHLPYAEMVKKSRSAIETYLVSEVENPNSSSMCEVIYALLPNGHTYSAPLELPTMEFYHEQSREIKHDNLIVHWKLCPFRVPILLQLPLGLLLAGATIGLTALVMLPQPKTRRI